MTAPLLSNWWYRVAERKPKLRSHARLHRHRYRGEVWYLLQDPASSRVHRFTPAARLIIALMDGTRSVAELWEIANKHLGEDAPTQDEMIQLLGQLHAADLLESDVTPDVAELFARGEREERARYLSILRQSDGDADPAVGSGRFSEPVPGLFRLIWSRWGAVAVACGGAARSDPGLAALAGAEQQLQRPRAGGRQSVVLYLVFPLIKALHELGHATATKAGGGEVHDMGIMLLVLLPVPYVEASAATVFKSKYRRALVGAAGVAVELFVAAIAFYLWLLVEPGLVRAMLFNVMLIASVSTLLFNGNPLLRYDAYYILADLIEIPNLAARSTRYWGYLIERYLLGVHEAEPPDASRSEKAWFALLRFCVDHLSDARDDRDRAVHRRTVLLHRRAAGALGGGCDGDISRRQGHSTSGGEPPCCAGIAHARLPLSRRHRARRCAFCSSVPMPYHSHAEGVLWLPEQAMVRAGANGFLDDFLIEPGTRVAQGERSSAAGIPRSMRNCAEAKPRSRNSRPSIRPSSSPIGPRPRSCATSWRANGPISRWHASGPPSWWCVPIPTAIFIVPQMVDMPGRYYRKGELLGYVMAEAQRARPRGGSAGRGRQGSRSPPIVSGSVRWISRSVLEGQSAAGSTGRGGIAAERGTRRRGRR